MRGYSRYVLERTVDAMIAGDAALSMLYGIRDYYPKFGYATSGPDHQLRLDRLDQPADLPPGWTVRPFVPADLPEIQRLYNTVTAESTGQAVRSEGSGPWTRLLATAEGGAEDACRVVVDPSGKVGGYAWKANYHWAVRSLQRSSSPTAFVLGEIMAATEEGAEAILAACRSWAAEQPNTEGQAYDSIVTAATPEGPVAAAAMFQYARFSQEFAGCGGSMARVLDMARLLESLQPELERCWKTAGSNWQGALRLQTELGAADLYLSPAQVRVEPPAGSERAGETVMLPQSELARLSLGSAPVEAVLGRLNEKPGAAAVGLLRVLFPVRKQHMSLPDRY
jgi:hypothetical protein